MGELCKKLGVEVHTCNPALGSQGQRIAKNLRPTTWPSKSVRPVSERKKKRETWTEGDGGREEKMKEEMEG